MKQIDQCIGEVVILHMTNGQPVIGKLEEVDPELGIIVIHKAMEMNFIPNPRNPAQIGVQFTPFLAFAGVLPALEKMPLDLADTLLVRTGAQVPKLIEDGYLQASTGVAIPNAGERQGISLVKP